MSGENVVTIASEDKKFFFFCDIVNHNFGIGGDNLILWRNGKVFLILKVADGSRESKIACAVSRYSWKEWCA